MGNLKNEAMSTGTEDIATFKLNDGEVGYLRLLNVALQFHTLGQKIMSGFLYYVSVTRLGYNNGVNLQFEFDFDKQDNMLTVKLLPTELTEQPTPEAAAPQAPEKPSK
jgi:hypothetical protein